MRGIKQKVQRRIRRKRRVRKRVHGTADRPRLTVFRSLQNMYAQLIDDDQGRTLAAASTMSKDVAGYGGNVASAAQVGKMLAEQAVSKGIKQAALDRNGYRYHGRVKALTEAAREAGLKV
jgi:large subunit ribosomal protein L18